MAAESEAFPPVPPPDFADDVDGISRCISQAVTTTMISGPAVPTEDQTTKEIRSRYLRIIKNTTWKRDLVVIGQAVRNLVSVDEGEPITTPCYLHMEGQTVEVPSWQTIVVGRMHECCFLVPDSKRNVSRVQMIMFTTDTKIIIIDMWSCDGTVVEGTEWRSVPDHRSPIILDRGSSYKIQCGQGPDGVTLNLVQNECVACMNAPSMVRFNCRHATLCQTCANEVTQCPICRAPVESRYYSQCAVPFRPVED